MSARPNLLLIIPAGGATIGINRWRDGDARVLVEGHDDYAPRTSTMRSAFRPKPGLAQVLAEAEGDLSLALVSTVPDRSGFPKTCAVVRFVDDTLSREMAQYIVMHVCPHRANACLPRAAETQWRQAMLRGRTEDTRVGILVWARRRHRGAALRDLGFGFRAGANAQDDRWFGSFRRRGELDRLPGAERLPGLRLAADGETRHILKRNSSAKLPRAPMSINARRAGT